MNKELRQMIEDVESGKLSLNDIRKYLGMDPIEGGDVKGIMTPTGFVPSELLGRKDGTGYQDISHRQV